MNPIQHGSNYKVTFGSGPKKAFLLTHIDLDGVSCELAFRLSNLVNEYTFECRRIDYNDLGVVDQIPEGTELVYITDVRCTDELLSAIAAKFPVYLIDHHQWPVIERPNVVMNVDTGFSAAYLCYWLLKYAHGHNEDTTSEVRMNSYFGYVNAYDMWLQKREPKKFELGKAFNHMLHTIGKDKFIERMMARLGDTTGGSILITKEEIADYERYQSGIKNKAEMLIEQMVRFIDNDKHSCGFVIAESVNSDVMNTVLELDKTIEYFVVYKRGKGISMRRQANSTIDLAVLAARYGGGGHAAAAGYPMPEHLVKGFRL